MEMLRFDESWTSIVLTLGTHSFWEFSNSSPLALDETLYLFRPCGAFSFLLLICWDTVYFIFQFSALSE